MKPPEGPQVKEAPPGKVTLSEQQLLSKILLDALESSGHTVETEKLINTSRNEAPLKVIIERTSLHIATDKLNIYIFGLRKNGPSIVGCFSTLKDQSSAGEQLRKLLEAKMSGFQFKKEEGLDFGNSEIHTFKFQTGGESGGENQPETESEFAGVVIDDETPATQNVGGILDRVRESIGLQRKK